MELAPVVSPSEGKGTASPPPSAVSVNMSAHAVEPMSIEWKHLFYRVPDKTGKAQQTILHDLSDSASPGDLVAVMGPSGSGKTSLLNILAQRSKEGVEGVITVNGKALPPTFRRFIGYVTQDEVWLNSLTVRESLCFAAELRLPFSWSRKRREARVDAVLDELDLGKCKSTIIGNIGKGISGGERRRLAIGMQVLSFPRLLFLDEPTSGLDAASALMLLQYLQQLSQRGCTIITTIHQPRYEMLLFCSKLILMADGYTLFSGPVERCLPFFERCGFVYPPHTNPSDFFLDVINLRQDSTPHDAASTTPAIPALERKASLDKVQKAFKGSSRLLLADFKTASDPSAAGVDDRKAVVQKLRTAFAELPADFLTDKQKIAESGVAKESRKAQAAALESQKQTSSALCGVDQASKYPTPFFFQLWVILRRSFMHKLREPAAVASQFANATVLPFLVTTIYWQQSLDQNGAYNRLRVLSLIIVLQAFFAIDIILLFPVERQLYLREQEGGLYRSSAYFLGRTLAELPAHVIFSWIVATISYFCIGLQNDTEKYFIFCGIVVNATVAGASLMLLAGSLGETMEQSNLIGTFFIIFLMLFDGSFVSSDAIPAAYSWVKNLSPMHFAVKSAMANEFRGLRLTCDDALRTSLGGRCPSETGEEFLEQHSFHSLDIARDMWVLILMSVVMRFVAYLCMRFLYTGKSFRERWNA